MSLELAGSFVSSVHGVHGVHVVWYPNAGICLFKFKKEKKRTGIAVLLQFRVF